MDAELQQFNQERAERLRMKHEKHTKELEAFDNESISPRFQVTISLVVNFRLNIGREIINQAY